VTVVSGRFVTTNITQNASYRSPENRLPRVKDGFDMLYEETERLFKRVKASKDICELRNMISVGYLITRWALERKECRGLHFTIDYPVHAYDK